MGPNSLGAGTVIECRLLGAGTWLGGPRTLSARGVASGWALLLASKRGEIMEAHKGRAGRVVSSRACAQRLDYSRHPWVDGKVKDSGDDKARCMPNKLFDSADRRENAAGLDFCSCRLICFNWFSNMKLGNSTDSGQPSDKSIQGDKRWRSEEDTRRYWNRPIEVRSSRGAKTHAWAASFTLPRR